MVKKHTKRSRQYGGFSWSSLNPFSSTSSNTDSYSSTSPNTDSYSSTSSNTNTFGNVLQSLKKGTSTATSWLTAPATPVVNQPPMNQYPMDQQSMNQQSMNQQSMNQYPMDQQPTQMDYQSGGKKAKSRKMKGGQGIAEYASPVHNLKVAEPTYWEYYGKGNVKTGGKKRKSQSKRKHKRRQTRRH